MYHSFLIHSPADGHLGCFHTSHIFCYLLADNYITYIIYLKTMLLHSKMLKIYQFFYLVDDEEDRGCKSIITIKLNIYLDCDNFLEVTTLYTLFPNLSNCNNTTTINIP